MKVAIEGSRLMLAWCTPYFLVILGVAGIAAGCALTTSILGEQRGLCSFFWLVPLASAKLWGRWPGILAALLSAAAVEYFVVQPRFEIGADPQGLAIRTSTMLVIAMIVSAQEAPAPTRAIRPRGGHNFWMVTPTGDYAADCAEGENRARVFLRELEMCRRFFVLGWMVRDMIAKGRYSGIEAGFFYGISRACLDGNGARLWHNHSEDLHVKCGVIETDGPIEARPVGEH